MQVARAEAVSPQNPRCTLYAGLVRSFSGSKCWLWSTMMCVQLPVSLLASVVAQAGGEVCSLLSKQNFATVGLHRFMV